ncbi:MAG: helix-turn-helix transcriptional regulator [Treponema sp.]|nr:helix-turn-helix transcriptional regulator [Treponema sp.]
MGFREFLKDEMEYQGLTTRALSEKSGVSKRTIDNYLKKNPQEPSVSNAYKIAKALNVSIEYLLTGEEYTGTIPLTGQLLEYVAEFEALTQEQKQIVQMLVKNLQTVS